MYTGSISLSLSLSTMYVMGRMEHTASKAGMINAITKIVIKATGSRGERKR